MSRDRRIKGRAAEPREKPVAGAQLKACAHCPWRLSNQGKRTPDGWYTKRNLASLWARLRTGDSMTCHPTDPANPVSDAQRAAGYREAKPDGETRECAGALILQGREAMVFADYAHREEEGELEKGSAMRTYLRERRRGLSREGLVSFIFGRGVFGGTPLGGRELARPDLADPDVGYAPLDGWEEPVVREQRRNEAKR